RFASVIDWSKPPDGQIPDRLAGRAERRGERIVALAPRPSLLGSPKPPSTRVVRMTDAMRSALLSIDAAIERFVPVPGADDLVRPRGLLAAVDALTGLEGDDRAAVVEQYASATGEMYEALGGLPETMLIHAE